MARTVFISLPLLLLVACGGSSGGTDDGGNPGNGIAQADFLLPDLNLTSPSYNTDVSPRDHQGGVSAWYFGSAT